MSEQRVAASPLQGMRILVTRTRKQASVLSEQLRSLGALPVEFPTIRIVPPPDWQQLDSVLTRLYAPVEAGEKARRYDWLVFTSANGVQICFDRLRHIGYAPQTLQHVRVAAIGPATAAALAHYGVKADIVPDEYIAESVAAALMEDTRLRGVSLQGQHILLACAAEARNVLVSMLRQAGAVVDEVPAYYTVAATADDAQGYEVLRLLRNQQLDMLTFTSPSTVRNFMAWLKSCEQDAANAPLALMMQHMPPMIACIGPITSQTARELGLQVTIEAKAFTIDGLVKAIVTYKESKERS